MQLKVIRWLGILEGDQFTWSMESVNSPGLWS